MSARLKSGDWIVVGHGAEADYGRVDPVHGDPGTVRVHWKRAQQTYTEDTDDLRRLTLRTAGRRFLTEAKARSFCEKRTKTRGSR